MPSLHPRKHSLKRILLLVKKEVVKVIAVDGEVRLDLSVKRVEECVLFRVFTDDLFNDISKDRETAALSKNTPQFDQSSLTREEMQGLTHRHQIILFLLRQTHHIPSGQFNLSCRIFLQKCDSGLLGSIQHVLADIDSPTFLERWRKSEQKLPRPRRNIQITIFV